MATYTALTIGPIYDTMELTSSPAGLWGASYLFSRISCELCKALVREGIPAEAFVAPYFMVKNGELVLSEGEDELCDRMRRKGVGLFHDRIIFNSEAVSEPLEKAGQARTAVINELASKLGEHNKDWLTQYLRILAVRVNVNEGESPLIEVGKTLSALELEPQFPSESRSNPLLTMFENTRARNEQSRNKALKESFLVKELDSSIDWMLYDKSGKNIRDLANLASQGIELKNCTRKYQQYYAVLKSDGDNMGKILESIAEKYKNNFAEMDKELRRYSLTCLTFCAEAAKVVQEFGGMPIYAGGDDLLVLLPVVGTDGKGLFALIEDLRTKFNDVFKEYRDALAVKPTISFGVAVQYYKSPLYEALERADAMLWKSKKPEIKNACHLHLMKHSGQSVEISEIGMDKNKNLYHKLNELYDDLRLETVKDDDKLLFLSGAGYQVEAHRAMFYMAVTDKDNRSSILENLYKNLFDNVGQKVYESYLGRLKSMTALIMAEQEGDLGENAQRKCVDMISAAIRIIHFLNEKKGEE